MNLRRRLDALDATRARRLDAPGGLTVDEKLAMLAECGFIEYRDHRVVVVDDAPGEVVAWCAENAPGEVRR